MFKVKTFVGVVESLYVDGQWIVQKLTKDVRDQFKAWLYNAEGKTRYALYDTHYKMSVDQPTPSRIFTTTVFMAVYLIKEDWWYESVRNGNRVARILSETYIGPSLENSDASERARGAEVGSQSAIDPGI